MSETNKNLITCVCTANICRSPMAELLLRHALNAEDSPLNHIEVISAGVYAYTGDKASPNSIRALGQVGLNLASHRSRQLTLEIVENSLLVLCMTESHREIIYRTFGDQGTPIMLMRELLAISTVEKQIPDPYGGSLQLYTACRDSMVEAIPAIIEYLKNTIYQENKRS